MDNVTNNEHLTSNNSLSSIVDLYRHNSISTSDIPHSLQVLTVQQQIHPKEERISQIEKMGFDHKSAINAYNHLSNKYNNNHDLFTTEECIEYIVSQLNQISDETQIIIPSIHPNYSSTNVNNQQKEEEKHNAITETDESDIETTNPFTNLLKADDIQEEEEKQSIYAGQSKTEISDGIECKICTEKHIASEIHFVSCEHNYCYKCIECHYRGQIQNGIVQFACMDGDCERPILESELYEFLDIKHKNKFEKFSRNVKLAKEPNIRWCIKPGCDTPILRKHRKDRKLTCGKCQTNICYVCAGVWHESTSGKNCAKLMNELLEEWVKNSNLDVQFCPKCAARIEKLSGCNHMTCAYCKYQFCWLCRRQFKKGHYDRSNLIFGCPAGENSMKRPNKCSACCALFWSCILMCCMPCRMCCWRMNEQGLPWCCCWCCCQD